MTWVLYSDIIFFGVLFYTAALILLFWIRYCVQYGILCPFSPTRIHCCFIPTYPHPFNDICTVCSMKKTPSSPYCCHRRHNFYDCCKCPKCEFFTPRCNIACCCWQLEPENRMEMGSI